MRLFKKYNLAFFLSVLGGGLLFAQGPDSSKVKLGLDTNYIRKYPDLLTFGLYISSPITEVGIHPLEDTMAQRHNTYKGNFASSLGFSLGYRGISITLGFRTSPKPATISQKGFSSYRNLQVKFRWKSIYASAQTSKFNGFYDENAWQSHHPFKDTAQIYAIRPDISMRRWLVSVTGNLSWRKYSYSGPYTYTERQIKSKVGFLLRCSVGHLQLKGDSALTHSLQDSAFSDFQHVQKLNALLIKSGPGIGLNIVVLKRFYFASTLFLQINSVFYQYTTEQRKVQPVQHSLASFAEGSLGFGFNSKRYFMGIHLTGVANRIKLQDARLDVVVGNLSLDLGFRFNCPKVLKEAWTDTLTRYFRL